MGLSMQIWVQDAAGSRTEKKKAALLPSLKSVQTAGPLIAPRSQCMPQPCPQLKQTGKQCLFPAFYRKETFVHGMYRIFGILRLATLARLTGTLVWQGVTWGSPCLTQLSVSEKGKARSCKI